MRTCCFVLVLFLTFLCFSNFYTEATQQILFHEVAMERDPVTLKCALSVGAAVKWSRDSNGSGEDVLTYAQGKTIKHIPDASKQYNTQADGALHFMKVKTSDSGIYYCNDRLVVNLTVASKNTRVTLRCPQSVGSTVGWRRRDSKGRDEDIRDSDSTTADAHRPYVSLEHNSLVIRSMSASSSGTYHCYRVKGRTTGKANSMTSPPLTITTTETSTTPPPLTITTTETSTTPEPSKEPITEPPATTEPRKPAPPHSTTTGPTEPLTTSRDEEPAIPLTTIRTAERTTPTQLPEGAVLLTVLKVSVCVLCAGLLIVTMLYLRRRCVKTQEVRAPPCGNKQLEHVYTEISDEPLRPLSLGTDKLCQSEPTVYSLATFPDEPNLPDHTYSMIPDPSLLPVKTADAATSNEPTYSLIYLPEL